MKKGMVLGLTLLFGFVLAANEYTSLLVQQNGWDIKIRELENQKNTAVTKISNRIAETRQNIDNPFRWIIFSLSYNLSIKEEMSQLSREETKIKARFDKELSDVIQKRDEAVRRLAVIRENTSVYMTGITLSNIPAYDWPSGQTDLRVFMRGSGTEMFKKDYCGSYFTGTCYRKINETDVLDIADADDGFSRTYENITQIGIGQIVEKALREDSYYGSLEGDAPTGKRDANQQIKYIRYKITYKKEQ